MWDPVGSVRNFGSGFGSGTNTILNGFSKVGDTHLFGNGGIEGFFDPGGFFGDFLHQNKGFNLQNPGLIDIHEQNPALAAQVDYLNKQRDAYDESMKMFGPAYYHGLMNDYGNRASTAAMNHYAALGLAGSAAGVGGADEARRQSDQAMLNRQVSDQTNIANTRRNYTSDIYSDTAGIQSGFNNYQKMLYDQYINQQNLQNAQHKGLLGTLGGVVGGIFGGLPGAQAGQKAGSGLGGPDYTQTSGASNQQNGAFVPQAQSSQYGSYQNPSYGGMNGSFSDQNYWSQNPYAATPQYGTYLSGQSYGGKI